MQAARTPLEEPAASGRAWPWIVVGFLLFCVTTQTILLVYATGDPSFVAEPDYYAQAVSWNERQAQEERNRELGWSLRVEGLPGGALRARLVDAQGQPLEGATLELTYFHKARAGQRRSCQLSSEAPGVYAARLGALRPGLHELRFEVERAGQRFTRRLDLDLRS